MTNFPTGPYYKVVPEKSAVVIYHRVCGPDYSDSDPDLIVADDVTSIAYTVVDLETGETIDSGALTPATVFPVSTVTIDSVVYNFKWKAPVTVNPSGRRRYRVEVVITPAGGEQPFKLRPVELDTNEMRNA